VPALGPKVLALAGDPSPKVRFQLLCTLGNLDSAASRAVQDRLLRQDFDDPWVQVAALSASAGRAGELLEAALSPTRGILATETKGSAAFLRQAAEVVGATPASARLASLLGTVTSARAGSSDWWRAALLEGLAQGVAGRGVLAVTPQTRAALVGLAFDRVPKVRKSALTLLSVAGPDARPQLAAAVAVATALAADTGSDPERRGDALRVLALAGPEPHRPLLLRMLDAQQPEEVQAAAVQALARIPGDDVGRVLLERWRAFTAPVRSEAADTLLADPGRTRLLVAALQKGEVQTWGLSFGQKRDLIMNDDPDIRAQARPLLESPPEKREKVVAAYQKALEVEGDAGRGQQVFERACSKCHGIDGRGANVGPDLGSVHNKAPSLLLADILIPSRAIAQNYESYVVETTSGDVLEGVLGRESPTAVVLRKEEAEEHVVPRTTIKKMYASNLSAMPADLEQQVDVQQMADLLKYLTGRRP
jgi:putative heme-binding domain-containing protein